MSTEICTNQGGAQGCSTGDAVFSAWRTAFCASGGSPAEWDLIKGSSALAWSLASDRVKFWTDVDSMVLGKVWDCNDPEVQGAQYLGLKQHRRWAQSAPVQRLPGWSGPVPAVSWLSPRWSNARLGAEGVKWEAALAAQSSGFDAGFARATGEDKSGVARWAHSFVRTTQHLYVSWLWELYVDLAGRTGGWVEALGSVERDSPPGGAGRASWMEEHPGGLDFPPGSVLWGGDAAGHGARVPFVRRASDGSDGALHERAPVYSGHSIVCVPSDEVVSFSASPGLAEALASSRPGVYVSRASEATSLWDDVVRLGAASLRPGLFAEGERIFLVLPGMTSQDLRVCWDTVGLSWRVGMVLPLRELAGHVQARARHGTREVPGLLAPRSDWAGALRLMADARFRVGGTRPVQAPGCIGYVSAFSSSWRARVAAVLGLLSTDEQPVEGPSGVALDRAVSVLGYEIARWTDRVVQRCIGHGSNLGLVTRGSHVYRALVRATSVLPGLHLSGGEAAIGLLPVLGYCSPVELAPAEPPDRWKIGARFDWNQSVVGGPADPWGDLAPETPLPKGIGGGLCASSWRVETGLREGAGPTASALSRAWALGCGVSVTAVPRGGDASATLPVFFDAPADVARGMICAPVELFANEAAFVSLVRATLRSLSEVDLACPGGAALFSADALEGLSF